jgi:hypothetical protein
MEYSFERVSIAAIDVQRKRAVGRDLMMASFGAVFGCMVLSVGNNLPAIVAGEFANANVGMSSLARGLRCMKQAE